MALALSCRMRSLPYWPTLSHKTLRRVLPGFLVSSLGDGMAVVAVSWLAIELVPEADRGVWVAIAVAAYTLPGAAGALVLGRFLRHRDPAQLAAWNATLRACALGAIPIAYAFGGLSVGLYIALLGVSSVLHSWGKAGVYAMLARLLPESDHLAGNAVLSTIGSFATVIGPVLAVPLIAWGGAATVVAVDAATFVVLALTFHLVIPAGATAEAGSVQWDASRVSGFGVVRRSRTLMGLLTLSACFFFLFGPVYVALPLYVSQDLHGSAGLLAGFYSAFGIGAVVGAVLTGYLRRWALLPTTIGAVVCFGAVMVPLGLGVPVAVGLTMFGLAGLLWPPYSSLSMTLFQRSTTREHLPQVLAAVSAVGVLSVPLGTALGGPLVVAFGASAALRFSAIGILLLGLAAAAVAVFRRSARHRAS